MPYISPNDWELFVPTSSASDAIFVDKNLSGGLFRFYLFLIACHQNNFWLSLGEIIKYGEVSKRTSSRNISTLLRMGYIKIETKKEGRYTLKRITPLKYLTDENRNT